MSIDPVVVIGLVKRQSLLQFLDSVVLVIGL
jgi:hypothetical protein